MDLVRGMIGKWLLSALYFGVWVALALLLPWGLGKWLVAIQLLYAVWLYLTNDRLVGRATLIRPLTPWDVTDYQPFRTSLHAACVALGLRREPLWAVAEEEDPNAWAVGGSTGAVVFSTGLLRTMTDDEILAVAGHELFHLRSHDALPAVVGGGWLFAGAGLSAWCLRQGERWPGIVGLIFLLAGAALRLLVVVMGYLAGTILATRSRTAEYLADEAGARVTSIATMCAALERLERSEQTGRMREEPPRWSMAWLHQRLHASHPPSADRLAHLHDYERRNAS